MRRDLNGDWAELSALLDAALELPAGSREAWLAELQQRNPAHHEWVSNLLAASEREAFGEFLVDAPAVELNRLAQATLAGRRVGAYTIDEEVGRGGMGSVWRAHRADGRFESQVAIKFVHAAWLGKSGEERFRREGKLLAQLHHRNIARLLDAGLLDATQPYLVLEFVDGTPIDIYADEKRLSLEARIRLFLDVLDAVSHAHGQLIVHRDIKPANVFVAADGVVKLLDFGIAKILDDPSEGTGSTRAGLTALTPEYAAPEQLLGRPVTTATDVYSLGLVLYQLLTGWTPDRPAAASRPELARALLSTDPVRASRAALLEPAGEDPRLPPAEGRAGLRGLTPRQLARALEGDLDNILRRALAPLTVERYASAGDFAADLRRYLAHEPVTARYPGRIYRFRKLLRRRPLEAALVAVVFASVLAGLATTTWQWRVAEARRTDALRQKERAEQMLARSISANEFTTSLLTQMAQVNHPVRFEDVARRGKDLALRNSGDPVQRSRALLALADFYVSISNAIEGKELARRSEELALKGHDAPLAAIARCVEALATVTSGNYEAATDLAKSGLQLAGDDEEARYRCLVSRGQIAQVGAHYPDAGRYGREALEMANHLRWLSATARAGLLDLVGFGESRTGNLDTGDRYFKRALEELERAGLQDSIEYSLVLVNVGYNLERRGQLLAALNAKERALSIERAILGDDGISNALWTNSARTLLKLNRLEDARDRSERGLAGARREHDDLGIFVAEVNLGNVLGEEHRLTEANRHYDEAAHHTGDAVPGSMVDSVLRFAKLRSLRVSEQWRIALGALDALERDQRNFATASGSQTVIRAFETGQLALRTELLMGDGRPDAALPVAEAALASARVVQGSAPISADTGFALLLIAELRARKTGPRSVLSEAREAERQLTMAFGPDHPKSRRAHALVVAASA